MTTGKWIVASALCGALYMAESCNVSGAEAWSDVNMKPLMAASFDVGTKHVVGYFLSADSRCKLTLMIGEADAQEQDETPRPGLRVQMTVSPGKKAHIDTEEGKSLHFACAPDGSAMNVWLLNRLAMTQDDE
jgi:hypothetical protein